MKQLLDRAQLRVPAGQRRLQPVDPLDTAYRRQDPRGSPQPLGFRLALKGVLPGLRESDPAASQPVGRPVGQHVPRLGHRLQPRGGVHRVPGHHPLMRGAQADRHLSGHHARPHGQARHADLRPEFLHRGHQVQRGPDRALRVPLQRGRGPPHRHHRVADELLDHSPVTADDRPGHPEILRQQLADRLRVPRLRQRGEPDHVAEQHRADPALRHRLRRPAREGPARPRGPPDRGTAGAAKTLTGRQRLAARWAHADGRPAIPTEAVVVSHRRTALPARHATVLTPAASAMSSPATGVAAVPATRGVQSTGRGRAPASVR